MAQLREDIADLRAMPKSPNSGCVGGSAVRYPWDQWADGRVWQLRQGIDFEVTARHFRIASHTTATRRGQKAVVRELGSGTILIQFTPKEA